jgi:diguanylate cyclase (GGDEF)-like protein/PAS domain S-box-containing protein
MMMSSDGEKYRLNENQYRMIVESAPNMIWRSGLDALCNYFNATWLGYTGRTMEQELGNGWVEGVHREDIDRCVGIYLEAFKNREPFEMLYRIRRFDGEYRWIHDKGTPYYNDEGVFCGYIGSCLDVNEQITGESWKLMAQRDGLTGILNRIFFDQEARKLYNTVVTRQTKLFAVMFDIDSFKYINDTYGHPFGDKILLAFSGILKENIRKSDLLGRYGGDEFLLMLPDADICEVKQIIARIDERLKQTVVISSYNGITVSYSCGISEIGEDETYESLIERADHAMYEEKRRKKNSVYQEKTL